MTKIYRVKLSELKKMIKEQNDSIDFISLPGIMADDQINVTVLKRIIEEFEGSTYPEKILKRRLGLLNNKEKTRVLKIWQNVHKEIEEIDNIISLAAEKADDPWR